MRYLQGLLELAMFNFLVRSDEVKFMRFVSPVDSHKHGVCCGQCSVLLMFFVLCRRGFSFHVIDPLSRMDKLKNFELDLTRNAY